MLSLFVVVVTIGSSCFGRETVIVLVVADEVVFVVVAEFFEPVELSHPRNAAVIRVARNVLNLHLTDLSKGIVIP